MTRTTKTRTRVILLIILGSLAAVVLFHLLGSSVSLRRYKAVLRAKGEKLTLAELAIPVSTNAEHVASRKVFFTNLYNFPTNAIRVMEYAAPGRARVGWRETLHTDALQSSGIVPAIGWDVFEQQVIADAPSLAVFREALKNPAPDGWYYHNDRSNAIAPKMNYGLERPLANGFLNAEMVALHHGDLDAAVANLHALAGLVRLNRNEATLVQPMVAAMVAELGLKGTWEALQAPGWNDEQLAGLQRAWEQVDLFAAMERGFLGERANNQDVMARVRKMDGREFHELIFSRYAFAQGSNSPPRSTWALIRDSAQKLWVEHLEPAGYEIFSVDEDELVQLRYFSGTVDAIHLLKANRPWAEAKAALERVNSEVEATFERDHFRRFMVARVVIPSSISAVERMTERETQRRLTVAAIALKRYQLKYGKPPETLATLTPEFLSAAPLDPMSGKALCYRLNADGTFTLYSVGKDGNDDGGTPGMGLWSAPDAVWPVAATNDAVSVTESTAKKN